MSNPLDWVSFALAALPLYLYVICFGSALTALAFGNFAGLQVSRRNRIICIITVALTPLLTGWTLNFRSEVNQTPRFCHSGSLAYTNAHGRCDGKLTGSDCGHSILWFFGWKCYETTYSSRTKTVCSHWWVLKVVESIVGLTDMVKCEAVLLDGEDKVNQENIVAIFGGPVDCACTNRIEIRMKEMWLQLAAKTP